MSREKKESKFLVFHKLAFSSYIVIYSDRPEKVYSLSKLPIVQIYRNFHILKGYKGNSQGLRKFYNDFVSWCNELRISKAFSFDYASNYTHFNAVKNFFSFLAKEHTNHDPIEWNESLWMERTNRGALQYCKPGTYESFGYDFSFNYPTIMASKEFEIPTKKGYEFTLKKIAEKSSNIQIGYYHVKITSDNENFRKIFAFSSEHVYAYTSVRFANDMKDKFNVKIEIFNDNRPNCYLYKKDVAIKCNEIFYSWKLKLDLLRKEFPKNVLVKKLGSTLWGSLSRRIRYFKTDDQLDDIDIGDQKDGAEFRLIESQVDRKSGKDVHTLIKYDFLYSTNLRLKSFLTAAARIKTAKLALIDIDNVIRVHTDNVTFTKKQDISNFKDLKPELKTSGKIVWKSVNKYEKEGIELNSYNDYDDFADGDDHAVYCEEDEEEDDDEDDDDDDSFN